MQMTGHKTRAVFERYNIVSPGDLREAAQRLDRFGSSAASPPRTPPPARPPPAGPTPTPATQAGATTDFSPPWWEGGDAPPRPSL